MPARPAAKSTRHVALLRGINVAGKNKLPMKDLVGIFERAGCVDVESYIQSGNVVFRADAGLTPKVPAVVSAAIAKRFGLRVPVVMRSGAELAKVAGRNPFLVAGEDTAGLHVVFLADAPARGRVAALDPSRSPGDTFMVQGKEVYLCCPNGFGRSKLTNDWFDRGLATIGTVRNWNTVLRLAAMASS